LILYLLAGVPPPQFPTSRPSANVTHPIMW